MNPYPLKIYLLSDKKNYYIRPCVCDKSGIARYTHVTEKIKYSCNPSELAETLFSNFDYMLKGYENDSEFDVSDNSPKISWRKSGDVLVTKLENGQYRISLEYYNHEIMSSDTFEERIYPADISAEELGKAVAEAMNECFDYALRQELAVYHSDAEGLLFIPMAINRTGYGLNDYCKNVPKPFAPESVRAAVEDVLAFISNNPEDKRTNKERKNNLPWRAFSNYKSVHGFVNKHHSIEMHRLVDGSFALIPRLRFDKYDSHYRQIDWIRTTCPADVSDQHLTEEIFAALERSRLISEKAKEPCGIKNELLFEYMEEMKKQIAVD